MLARAVIGGIVVVGALGACSYTKADDAPVPARITTPVVPTVGSTVVGTLPPITNVATTAAVTTAPAGTPAAPATTTQVSPPTEAPPPATTAARPASTAARPAGSASVQAGSFSTREGATAAIAALAAKGFGGFGVSGGGPFRVVRGGLSQADANALVQSLAAAGVSAFVRS